MTVQVPAVAKPRPVRIPDPVERTLRNGLRVVAVRKPGIPLVHFRLRMPAGYVHDRGAGLAARLLPETILAGTERRDAVQIARDLQALGAQLYAVADPDDLVLSGNGLASSLGPLFELLAEVVTRPTFPARETAIARDRVAQEILIARSQPGILAQQAWRARVFGRHPYGRRLPDPDAARRTGRGRIEAYWRERVTPRGATLVVVGDIRPAEALDEAERALARWRGGRVPGAERPADPPRGAPILLVDRPRSVQTTIRLVGPALPRRDPRYYALALANMVFGGYFSSRLVQNIREEKGYTYSPGSGMDHRRLASLLVVAADVGAEVTAPALVEIAYELGRMVAQPVPQDELDAARRYFAGVTMLSMQTQAGLAGTIDSIVSAGLDVEYLRAFAANLERVSRDDVLEAARQALAPAALTTVLVGDASAVRDQVAALGPLEVASL